MRFSAALVVGIFAAFAAAESTTTTAAAGTTVASGSTAESSAQAAITKCLDACAAGDVDCQSKCIAVPNPSTSQVNATNNCVAACPQGNGTATDNLNYENCVNGCIANNYFTTTGTPAPTNAAAAGSGTAATGTATGTGTAKTGTATDKSSASTGTGTASGSSSSATTTKSAGEALRVTTSAFGLVGLVAALFAV